MTVKVTKIRHRPGKKAAVFHDISGFGKCSGTVVLPVLSAAGIQTSILPTAVLSTHTGGLGSPVICDLTKELLPMASHWEQLGLSFDALYSGYLGSTGQIQAISDIFSRLKGKESIILVDPVMGDNGKIYQSCDPAMCEGMKKLCTSAGLLTPNLTEAAFLLRGEYPDQKQEPDILTKMMKKLADLGPEQIVLTGISLHEEWLGASSFDRSTGKVSFYERKRIPGHYHGTGDIFSSVLLAGRLQGNTLERSVKCAVDFTADCILSTYLAGTDPRYGVLFEGLLPNLRTLFSK